MRQIIYILIVIYVCSCGEFSREQDNIQTITNEHIKLLTTNNIKLDSIPLTAYEYKQRGNQKNDLGDHQGAFEDYTRAIMVNSNYDTAYLNRGLMRYELGDKQGEIVDYTKAIEINPKYLKPYINRAIAKHELGDDEGEIADYRLAIKNCKPDADIYNNLGTALYDLKRFKESADAYTEGIKHFPKDYRFYYGRGLARHQMEDRDGACEDWHKSSTLGCFEANAMFPLCNEDYKNKHKK